MIVFFMAGMAMGSWCGIRRSRGASGPGILTMAMLQFAGAVASLLLCAIFAGLVGIRGSMSVVLVAQFLFPGLALLSGLLGGFQFPIASRIFFSNAESHNMSVGTLYAADLVGAAIGAIAISTYLLPVFGFLKSAALIAVVNLIPGVLACSLAFPRVDLREP